MRREEGARLGGIGEQIYALLLLSSSDNGWICYLKWLLNKYCGRSLGENLFVQYSIQLLLTDVQAAAVVRCVR